MNHLGGHSIFLSTNDIQLGRGENIEDTARVISTMVDFIMLRISSQEDMNKFASNSNVPVINALSDEYHPTQLIADYITMLEHGKENGKIAYIGDGNNMANSWVILASKLGLDISIASPKEYSIKKEIREYVNNIAKTTNANILFTTNPNEAIKNVDIVVTDTYVSMGAEKEKEIRDIAFKNFCIDDKMMSLAKKDAIFMHCLPVYRGKEASSSVVDGKNSVIYDEAENRLTANKGILKWLLQNQ
jgi:ornithine carbamoyltransferase